MAILNIGKENSAASSGLAIQVSTILPSTARSVGIPQYKFQPIIAPTIACEVETGTFRRVIQAMVPPAARATVNDPARAFTAPNSPRVSLAPAPLITAPKITKTEVTMAAARNLIIRVPTAVPKIFAASLAPNDQPKNSPLSK